MEKVQRALAAEQQGLDKLEKDTERELQSLENRKQQAVTQAADERLSLSTTAEQRKAHLVTVGIGR